MSTGAAIAAAFWGIFDVTAPPEEFLVSSQVLGHLQTSMLAQGRPP